MQALILNLKAVDVEECYFTHVKAIVKYGNRNWPALDEFTLNRRVKVPICRHLANHRSRAHGRTSAVLRK